MKSEFFNSQTHTQPRILVNFRNNRNNYLLHSRVLVKSFLTANATASLHYYLFGCDLIRTKFKHVDCILIF